MSTRLICTRLKPPVEPATFRPEIRPASNLVYLQAMRYLVKARVKPGREKSLLQAIADGSLGRGSIAGDEYDYDMRQARLGDDGVAHWVETCFCATPLAEERSYWEEFFELLSVKDAHNRKNCRHENGTEPWACCHCDCTRRLEERLAQQGKPLLPTLQGAQENRDA